MSTKQPEVELYLNISDRSVEVVEERFDASIRSGSQLDPTPMAKNLGSRPLVPCESPDYLPSPSVPPTPLQLADPEALTFRFPRWEASNAACPPSSDDRNAFVVGLLREYGQQLRRYLRTRLRTAPWDVSDLEQEVYLCMLRTGRHESIQSPRAYLFTIAHHVLCKHHLAQSALPESLPMAELVAEMDSFALEDPHAHLDLHERFEEVDRIVKEISPRAYATFVLRGRFGFTLEEIAGQLGVSRPMIKKYFAQVIAHCRNRFDVGHVDCS